MDTIARHSAAWFLYISCLLVGSVLGAQSEDRDGNLIVPRGRVAGLEAAIGDPELVAATLRRIERLHGEGDGVWAVEWQRAGDKYREKAEEHARSGDDGAALDTYLEAMELFRFGYLPDNFTPQERESFRKFTDAYLAASRYFPWRFEVVQVPFEAKEIVVHLHRPADVVKPPLVLYTGGIDGSKESGYEAAGQLVGRDFAMAAFDLAGTGDSEEWLAEPDSHKLHRRVLDFLESTGNYDFDRVGLIGGSFGGYYAVKMAIDEPRVKAVVSNCGLVHAAFNAKPEDQQERLESEYGGQARSFMRRVGLDPAHPDLEKLTEIRRSFSLLHQGIVGSDKVTIKTPLLILNGGRDTLSPISDMKMLEAAAEDAEMWVFGLAGHCGGRYGALFSEDLVRWLVDHLP